MGTYLVRKLKMRITRVITWLIGVNNLLTKSGLMPIPDDTLNPKPLRLE